MFERHFRPKSCVSRIAATLLAVFATSGAFAQSDDLVLQMNEARMVRLPQNVATLVVGNPMIADGTPQNGGILVITGKSYGRTNLVALDAAGAVLLDRDISVTRGGVQTVTVYRANARETLNCSPACDPVLSIGDEKPIFELLAKQIEDRNALSTGQK